MAEYRIWFLIATAAIVAIALIVMVVRGTLSKLSFGKMNIVARRPQQYVIDLLVEARDIAEMNRGLTSRQRRVVQQKLRSFRSVLARAYKELFVSKGYQASHLKYSTVYRLLMCYSNEMKSDITAMVMRDVENNHFSDLGDASDVDYYVRGKVSSIIQYLHEQIDNNFLVPANSRIQSQDVLDLLSALNDTLEATFRSLYMDIIQISVDTHRDKQYAAERLATILVESGELDRSKEDQVIKYLMEAQ